MEWLKWLAAALAFTEAGWMVFDGGRALLVGDYVTPKTGEYAGQLGPWTKLVSLVGLEPRSALMKGLFVGLGAAWMLVIVLFLLDAPWGWWAMLATAVGSLWYLWIGTIMSGVVIALLLVLQLVGA